jgi:hypothetical protein
MAHGDNRSVRQFALSVVWCLLLGISAAAGQAPAESFEAIYGDAMDAVASTRDSADDVRLAWQLVRQAEQSGQYPALAALMCQRAYELSLEAPDDPRLPIRALEQVAQFAPDQGVSAWERIVGIYEKRYASAKGGLTSRYAGRMLIDAQQTLAEYQTAAGEWKDAQATLRAAARVAEKDVPRREGAVAARLSRLEVLRAAGEAIASAEEKFAQEPTDALRSQLAYLYVTGLNDPEGALRYLDGSQDMILGTYVPLAAQVPETLTPAAARELGDWYATLAKDESAGVDVFSMLDRARTYYTRALAGELNDADRADLQTRLDRIADAYSDRTGLKLSENRFSDLLELISASEDLIEGRVSSDEAGLRLGAGRRSQLKFPVRLTGGYVLRTRVTRLGGDGPMRFILPVGDTHVMLVLDENAVTGLEDLDGQPAIRNATGVLGSVLDVGQPVNVEVSVRWTNLGTTVIVKMGGAQKIRWTGQATSLTLPKAWAIDQTGAMILGVDTGVFLLDTIELKPEDESAVRLR